MALESDETRAAFERHARYVDPAFTRMLDLLGYGRLYVRASGTKIWDAEGRAYTDFLAGCGSVPLGYNHPELVAAAEASLRASVPSFMQLAPQSAAGMLAEALASRLGSDLSRAHFASSGSEAVDGALKLAFAATRRRAVLHCERSYHGVSLGVLPIMGAKRLRAPFPTLLASESIPFGDAEALERKLRTERFAAFVVEPIQFEGGVYVAPDGWLSVARALCEKHGTVLVFDEAQTGMGRTGAFFAHQALGVVPDVVVYAKALSGGLVPIAGYSTSPDWQRRAYGKIQDFEYVANTFGGGALACAVALRTVQLIDETLLAHVRAMGEHLAARLGAAVSRGALRAARGKGLLWGVACTPPTRSAASVLTLGLPNLFSYRVFAYWIGVCMMERGFLTQIPTHDMSVLRIEPPLIVEKEEIDAFVDALDATLAENEGFLRFARRVAGRFMERQIERALARD
ncbi:MAG TPA: aspartate aminotransferase family protein [Labilithrix sp.]|jgi:putrescine aminotransferase